MPDADRKEVLERLGYEWWMFRETRELFRCAPKEHSAARNAFAESLTIHGRGLVQFFYYKKGRSTDWNVTDLGMDLPRKDQRPPELEKWYDATGQHVAHLTQHRVQALGELKTSRVNELLAQCIERVKTRMGSDMPARWIGDCRTMARCANDGPESGPFGATGPPGPV